ncbi:Asp-tRNA(Asn)/Glu-tRNA(Gln) amidotransferase subunit GatC [Candidatus Parcubacteria bacterium]|nr:Asp-tRNA(Asn)/Glu-tRNA(Gln) amidotransferase subunit GatC [Candidatus Parcubacteria bacterium]
MNKEEVLKLAKLARIEISSEEAESLAHEFEAILKYVGEIKGARLKGTGGKEKPLLRNVMREDVNPHESGIYTEALLNAAPKRKGQYVSVKKIL